MRWPLDQFNDKHVVFVGAGLGRAVAGIKPFLEKHSDLASFSAVDKQTGDAPLAFLRDYDPDETIFIKNEGIPGREMPVPYTTPMELFFSLVPQTGATTIGITGTKGKSTTAALVAHILKAGGKQVVLAGNIGVSPFDALETATQDSYFVLELSSYQLSDLHYSPHISACLNLYNDHMTWHGSLAAYWEAKHRIMRYADQHDVFIYNPDFPALRDWAAHAICQTLPLDTTEPFDLSKAQLFGDHNRLNVLVARDIARICGVDDTTIQRAVDSFVPLRHRMQIVATKQGRTYIDDAIGMNPDATSASLRAIAEKYTIGCLMLGGMDRDYDFTGVLQLVADLGIPYLVLFPDTIEKMRDAFPTSYNPTIFETRDMSAAVQWAAGHAPKDTAVVLSTAAPSYSIWRDFEEKGDLFQAVVDNL